MPARYRFLPEHNGLYLRFEDPFLFGKADDLVTAFTADPAFSRSHTLIFDFSRLTNIRVDVTGSADKVAKVGKNLSRDGGQVAVLAPTETGRSMAELLRKLWAHFPQVGYHVFTTEADLLHHVGLERECWDVLSGDFHGTTP